MLPKIQMTAKPMDQLQMLLKIRERGARRNMYEKDYADKTRSAKVRDIEVGILKQNKRNMLTTAFETESYEMIDR